VDRPRTLPRIDRIFNSHCHEDHIAGNSLFPEARCHLHAADAVGLRDLQGMMDIYGYASPIAEYFEKAVVERFHYAPRDGVETFDEADVFDLGGVAIEVLHTPGHTRGHSCLLIKWNEADRERRLLYLGDIELTSFGPYYGDAWSNLVDFEHSLARVRAVEADWYATFHHIGVLAGREAFLERLDKFESMIGKREARLLGFLDEPRSVEDIMAFRFVFRPGDDVPYADAVEKRSAEQHLERWIASGVVTSPTPGRYVRSDPDARRPSGG
jgi:glyoxylase-like metal-dependent hydrolase (beta-lactamase superfamily II)